MKELFRSTLRKIGFDVIRYPYFADKVRLELFKKFNINTIVDIGANEGQYATFMWDIGYKGTIISFEPVSTAYAGLVGNVKKGRAWIKHNFAIGAYDGKGSMNVTDNLLSSSLLFPRDELVESTPDARVIRTEEVEVRKLDTVFDEVKRHRPGFFLKIDSQGYERIILEGAKDSLGHFSGIQIELSITRLYNGESTFVELLPELLSWGFTLYEMEKGYCNPMTGEIMQVELILFRNK